MTFNEIEFCFFLIDIYNIVLLLRASFLDKLLQDTTFPNSALSGKYDYQTFLSFMEDKSASKCLFVFYKR